MKKALVAGAGGFIGNHLVKRLKDEGYWVRGVDIKFPEYSKTLADEFLIMDLREKKNCLEALTLSGKEKFDEVYQLAADMGGAGYIFTGENDFDIMHNSSQINLNFASLHNFYNKLFYSSSACIYPQQLQESVDNPGLKESDAYPANPDSEYGWEKIFSERLYMSMSRKTGIPVRIARFHNVYGPEGTYKGGREKAPAAISRKVAEAELDGKKYIEIWGDGQQTRSFLYIDEALEGVRRLMDSNFSGPVNIGSDEMVSINDLARMVMDIAGLELEIKNIPGPLGVRGRNSDNSLIKEKLGWAPNYPLRKGMEKTYKWVRQQVFSERMGLYQK
ncbi:MAG: NAD-dependent dehydratase [Candidatus Parcubacteria bacterium]|nr:MAG: NAD-dependent dehydratase [Candidatus Pacearchaeota archaeon]GIW65347.1 MAG: NAD-dependent dehydratase [Candidatus Parcubacteria bacterium]